MEEKIKQYMQFLKKNIKIEERWQKDLEGDIKAFEKDTIYFGTVEKTLRQLHIRLDQLENSNGKLRGYRHSIAEFMKIFDIDEE